MEDGVQPLLDNRSREDEAYGKIIDPFRKFMLTQVRDKDLSSSSISPRAHPASRSRRDEVDMRVLDSGLHDLGTAARLRDRLPYRAAVPRHRHDRRDAHHVDGHDDDAAAVISLPIKILFFILIDGWNMLIGSLIRSYH